MRIKAGSNLLVQIHYPIGSAGKVDSTSILLYLYSDSAAAALNPPMRELKEDLYIMNWTFAIPANSTQTITAYWPVFGNTTQDLSLFSVDPHMHLLGRKTITFAVTANHDTIPLNKIDDWRYAWQSYYFFKNMVKIPAGSKLYTQAFYDNTSSNPYNPFTPPQLCLPGENTTNEMELTACQYTVYQAGDENFDMQAIINNAIGTSVPANQAPEEISFTIYPNPSDGQFIIAPMNMQEGKTEITVSDILGQPVLKMNVDNANEPINLNMTLHPDGIYLVQIKKAHYSSTQRIIVARK